ncbi:MAG: T9SS type A sorting domain-containing protein, partial [Bacteroidota bacterium]
PLFCGEAAMWCVFNTETLNQESGIVQSPGVEIQMLAYAYATDPANPLHFTTFYDYKLINRGTEDLTDFYAGIWIDFDLGCFTDDFLGSIPDENLVYVHNDAGDDEDFCDFQVASLRTSGVIQTAQIVNSSVPEGSPLLHSFTTVSNAAVGFPDPATTDPSAPNEYLNLVQGLWRDGTPITRGGNGYGTSGTVTKYAFDGGALPNGSSWRSCSENLSPADLRGIMSTGPYTLQPQEIATFTLAMTTLFEVDFPGGFCPDTEPIISAARDIKAVYNGFCSPDGLVSADAVDGGIVAALVYPNPTDGQLTIELPSSYELSTLEIYDLNGKAIATFALRGNRQTISVSQMLDRQGLYIYRLRTREGEQAAGRFLFIK